MVARHISWASTFWFTWNNDLKWPEEDRKPEPSNFARPERQFPLSVLLVFFSLEGFRIIVACSQVMPFCNPFFCHVLRVKCSVPIILIFKVCEKWIFDQKICESKVIFIGLSGRIVFRLGWTYPHPSPFKTSCLVTDGVRWREVYFFLSLLDENHIHLLIPDKWKSIRGTENTMVNFLM